MASRPNRARLRLVEPEENPGNAAVSSSSTPLPGVDLPSGATRTPVTVPASSPSSPPASATWETRQRTPSMPDDATRAPSSSSPNGRALLAALPDAQLVALGCKGETHALEVLYRRHASFAIHLAARIEGSARDVEDIVHDAFLRAFERLNDLTDRGAFRSWLGAIVVHAVRSRMRRARLMSLLGMGKAAEPVDLDALASPDASPHVRAQIAQIYALLRTLPTDERIAWTLRAVEGHDLETVARLTRCSLATVKRRIGRTQRFLDEHFVDAHAPDDEAPARPSIPSAPDP
jgi:RNA polymerase sigma-70 factor (ECF subfamily)